MGRRCQSRRVTKPVTGASPLINEGIIFIPPRLLSTGAQAAHSANEEVYNHIKASALTTD